MILDITKVKRLISIFIFIIDSNTYIQYVFIFFKLYIINVFNVFIKLKNLFVFK